MKGVRNERRPDGSDSKTRPRLCKELKDEDGAVTYGHAILNTAKDASSETQQQSSRNARVLVVVEAIEAGVQPIDLNQSPSE